MPKILVLDHSLNTESMASCSLEQRDLQFFGLNTAISIDENIDICKPDYLLINQYFITQELFYQMMGRFEGRTMVYSVDHLIPNAYVGSRGVGDRCCVICLHDNHLINSNKLIHINGSYPAIYSYKMPINHPQMAGMFYHAKDLFELCESYGTIIDASGGYLAAFCKFYGWKYGSFKPSGTISIHDPQDIQQTYTTNKQIYEQYMQHLHR